MQHSIRSTSPSRRVLAASVAAVALSIAACQDASTAPTGAGAGSVAGPNNITAVVGGGFPKVVTFISVHVVDVSLLTVPEGSWVKFRWSSPTDSLAVADNGPQDLDPAVGFVKIAAPFAASYEACVRGETKHYYPDTTMAAFSPCVSKAWTSSNMALGYAFMRQKPQVTVRMEDLSKKLLPGGTLHVWNTLNGWTLDVADGSAWDESPGNDGKITVTLPRLGYYLFSEQKAPSGHWEMTGPTAYGWTPDWEKKRDLVFSHQQVAY